MIKKSRNDKVKVTESVLRKLIKSALLESLGSKMTQDVFVPWNINSIMDEGKINALIENGVMPEELYGDFEIGVRIIYDTYEDTYDVPGGSNELGRDFIGGGDYDEAKRYISMIKDENIKKQALMSLEDCLFSNDYREGDITNMDDYYEDDKFDRMRDERL